MEAPEAQMGTLDNGIDGAEQQAVVYIHDVQGQGRAPERAGRGRPGADSFQQGRGRIAAGRLRGPLGRRGGGVLNAG